jgi:serpin B
MWGQQGAMFLDPFLDTLALNYGAGLRLLDFVTEPDKSRTVINDWVEEQTDERIKELLPKDSIDPLTVMVLVNAIYFNAAWQDEFVKDQTKPGDFTTLAGEVKSVPMMSAVGFADYYSGDGVQAVEKFYDREELSMVLIVPDAGTLPAFEAALSAESLHAILAGLEQKGGLLRMPKWRYEGASISLKDVLSALGMSIAFGGDADFSRMLPEPIEISNVYHQAFIAVDEAGTEAAAATAVVGGRLSITPTDFELTVDRPFIYLIRDLATDTIVFMGRVTDPS